MGNAEQLIKIAAKLYKCRDSAKALYGDNYYKNLVPYHMIICDVMKSQNCTELEAILHIADKSEMMESGINIMMFMAAVCEIIEPSEPISHEKRPYSNDQKSPEAW